MSQIIDSKKAVLDPENWPNVLITTDDWFKGPDGNEYRFIYGPMDIVTAKALLGFDPKSSTNWFAAIGEAGRQMIVMGCRIHYVAMCLERPGNMNNVLDLS